MRKKNHSHHRVSSRKKKQQQQKKQNQISNFINLALMKGLKQQIYYCVVTTNRTR